MNLARLDHIIFDSTVKALNEGSNITLITDRNTRKISISSDTAATAAAAGITGEFQYNDNGVHGAVASLIHNSASGDIKLIDDKKIYFGSDSEGYIQHRTSDGFLDISGSANGIVLSGSTIQIRGTLVGASPLKIAGGIEIVQLEGQPTTAMSFENDTKVYFGDNEASYLAYSTSRATAQLELSSSNAGVAIYGTSTYIDQKLGIGVSGNNITHGITLPDSADDTGKIKANAYVTYSSISLKENISKIKNPIDILKNIEGVTFNWKKNKKEDIGFIAEHVGKQLPQIVEWEDNQTYAQGMDYNKIVPILVEAIKCQQSQIDKLKKQIIFLNDVPLDN